MFHPLLCCFMLLSSLLVSQETEIAQPFEVALKANYSGKLNEILGPNEPKGPSSHGNLLKFDHVAVSDEQVQLFGRKARAKLRQHLPSVEKLKTFDSVEQYEKSLGEALILPFDLSVHGAVEDGNTTIYSTKEWAVCCFQSDGTIRYLNVFIHISEFFDGQDIAEVELAKIQASKTTIEIGLIREAVLKSSGNAIGSSNITSSNSQLKKLITGHKELEQHRGRILEIIGNSSKTTEQGDQEEEQEQGKQTKVKRQNANRGAAKNQDKVPRTEQEQGAPYKKKGQQ